jgi:hypothetical protein
MRVTGLLTAILACAISVGCGPSTKLVSLPPKAPLASDSMRSPLSVYNGAASVPLGPEAQLRWVFEHRKPVLEVRTPAGTNTIRGDVLRVIVPSPGRSDIVLDWRPFRIKKWYSVRARSVAAAAAYRSASIFVEGKCYFDFWGNPVCPGVGGDGGGGCELTDPTCSGTCDPNVDPACLGFCTVNPNDPLCQPPSSPPTPSPVYANYPETPDDADGPGHGPQPNLGLPLDQACPSGWSLSFSNGNGGNPIGGAYCGVDFSGDPSTIAMSFSVDLVRYATDHYWNRHLACYVYQSFTSNRWNTQLIGPDFLQRAVKPTSRASIAYVGASMIIDNAGTSTEFGYRVALFTKLTIPALTVDTYNVGTSYLVPRRLDCPKPYPNYP